MHSDTPVDKPFFASVFRDESCQSLPGGGIEVVRTLWTGNLGSFEEHSFQLGTIAVHPQPAYKRWPPI